MGASSKKDLSVFEFDAEEEAVETLSHRFRQRIESKKPSRTGGAAVDKYAFLQAFQGLTFERTDPAQVVCIDSPERDSDLPQVQSHSVADYELVEKKSDSDEIAIPSTSYRDREQIEILDEADTVSVISDEEEIPVLAAGSQSSSSCDLLENEGSPESQDLYSTTPQGECDSCIMPVTVSPNYILYRKTYYGDAKLMFFSDGIRIMFSDEMSVLEFAITDIVLINSYSSQSVQLAIVRLYLRNPAIAESDRTHDSCDVEELMFSMCEMRWLGKMQSIMSLAERYQCIWSFSPDNGVVSEDDSLGPCLFISKNYFVDFEVPLEDFIYPKDAPDAVSVSRRDIEVLQPDTFINDTIIDFYIQYLKSKIPPHESRQFHFFNSFFFRKLADLDKDPENALEGKAAFQRVRKWTRKVNIFEKDYIFIPVNFNFHWSLLVICHPGEISTMRDSDVKESVRLPCILHMNSIKGTHTGLATLIQRYLQEEWKERRPESTEDCLSRFSNLKFVSLELPQQQNLSDCGLFLLHYVELFLKEAPADFNPFSVTKFSGFLTESWFLPAEASHKRSFIRKVIYDLVNDGQRPTLAPHSNMHLSSGYTEKDHEQGSPENSTTAKVVDSAPSFTEGKIEFKLLAASSTPDFSECGKQDMVLQNFFAPRATAEFSTQGMNQPFQPIAPSCKVNCKRCPAEEYADRCKQCVSASLYKDCHQLVDLNMTPQICPTSYSTKDVGACDTSWMSEEVEEIDTDSSSESLSGDYFVLGQKVNTEMSCFLLENCGYVPDTPSASDDEMLKECFEDSLEIDTIMAEGCDCEGFQELCASKLNSGDGDDCRDNGAAKGEIGHTEDCLKIDSSKTEEPDIKDCQNVDTNTAGAADSEACEDINTAKLEGRNDRESDTTKGNRVKEDIQEIKTSKGGEACQDINTAKLEGGNDRESDTIKGNRVQEDIQEIETSKGGGDNELQKVDTADASIGCSSGHCSESFPSQSFQNIVISDDEGSLDVEVRQRRYQPGARSKQQPCKRRKLVSPVGGRKLTRSYARSFFLDRS